MMSSSAADFDTGGAADLASMAEALSVALALDMDRELRVALRKHATCAEQAPLLIKFSSGAAVLEISGTAELKLARKTIGAPVWDLGSICQESPILDRRIDTLRVRTDKAAEKMILPLISPKRHPSRSEFEAVYEWAPLIEVSCYRFATRLLGNLDAWREGARIEATEEKFSREDALERYFALNHTLAHFALMASSRSASEWLAEMAHSFAWVRWTPTFALTRERTVWLAAAAAKSAAAFGPAVIDRYLERLSNAEHAFNVFDALFGLCAIAIAHDHTLENVTKEVEREALSLQHRGLVGSDGAAAAFRSALEILRNGPAGRGDQIALTRLHWEAGGRGDGLFSRQAFRLDPTETDSAGRMLGFAALPEMLHAAPGQHYCRSKSRISQFLLRRDELPLIMERAWSSKRSQMAHQTVH